MFVKPIGDTVKGWKSLGRENLNLINDLVSTPIKFRIILVFIHN